jgi:CheY-like chemotaxis protein
MRTVLIVEDYDDVRGMLKLLLESEKFRVVEAASGGEALEVIKDHRPDAILMDLALPGLDGFETIRRIRAIDAFQNTPIIVLTAYTGPSTYDAALRAGTNFLMGKPVDFDQLAALLKRVLFEGNWRNARHNRAASQRAMLREKPMVPPRGGRELHYSV